MNRLLDRFRPKAPTVNVVHLHGVITGARARVGLSFANIEPVLTTAFLRNFHKPDAVALVVNSPGGSPVQSSLIGQRIQQLKSETNIPVWSFAEDAAASGGYWLLCAGDQIFADRSSIVGSIGVVGQGFGFVDAISKLGVTRRLLTAGSSKARLDPFLPLKPADQEYMQAIAAEIHEHFKSYVRDRRGAKIDGKEADIFTGDVFTGQTAMDKGLVDQLGNLHQVARQKLGKDVRLRDINSKRIRFPLGFDAMLQSGSEALLDSTVTRVEERLLRQQIGL